jgi:hypothetical protein
LSILLGQENKPSTKKNSKKPKETNTYLWCGESEEHRGCRPTAPGIGTKTETFTVGSRNVSRHVTTFVNGHVCTDFSVTGAVCCMCASWSQEEEFYVINMYVTGISTLSVGQ